MSSSPVNRINTRRDFFRTAGLGLGSMALADLLQHDGLAGESPVNPLAPRPPHFAPKAKNVIFLFMEGAPSQMDLFDPKPELQKWQGKPLPESMTKQVKLAFIKPSAAVLGSPRIFKPYGQCGAEYSDFLPHTGT